MLFLDLDELDQLATKIWAFSVERANLISFRRADYLRIHCDDLKNDIKRSLASERDFAHLQISRVSLLTQPRYFGLSFNPLSLFYCYDQQDKLQAIVAEVHNTPWNERHRYLIPASESPEWQYTHHKDFHVSPFNPMNLNYHWTLTTPDEQLKVVIDARIQAQDKHRHFIAAIGLRRTSVNRMPSLLIRYPLSAVTTVLRIYYQAFRLWLKKVPFFSHPKLP